MLSRIASRWGSEEGDEGGVQGSVFEDYSRRADSWAADTVRKTHNLSKQQRDGDELVRKRKCASSLLATSTLAERTNIPRQGHSRSLSKGAGDTTGQVGLSATTEVQSAPRSQALEPPLSAEQQEVFDMVVNEGRSLMFTGGAGTGKSVLARSVVKALCVKYGADRVGVTATTGIAALHIGGRTLHSWTGVGIGNGTVKDLSNSIARGPRERRERWKQAKALVIDEVSMLDAVFFDKLESVARAIRNSEKPFGGIQLVLVGDFYQLPPVTKGMTNWKTDKADMRVAKRMHEQQVAAYPSRLLFHAFKWSSCVPVVVVLKTVFRQSDSKFVSMLEELRRSRLSPETISTFQSLSRALPVDDGILPTELYPTRNEVSNSNEARLKALRTHTEVYIASDRSRVHQSATTGSQDIHAWLDKMTMFPHHLELREKAQVMLLKNCNEDLVNGSRGIIVGFLRYSKHSKARRAHGRVFYPRQGVITTTQSPPNPPPRTGKPVVRVGIGPEAKAEDDFDEFDDPEMDAALEQIAVEMPQQPKQPQQPQQPCAKSEVSVRAGSLPPVLPRTETKNSRSASSADVLSSRSFQRVQSEGPRSVAQSSLLRDLALEQAGRGPDKRGDVASKSRFATQRTRSPAFRTAALQNAGARSLTSVPRGAALMADLADVDDITEYIEVALPPSNGPMGGLEMARDAVMYPIVRFVNGKEYLVVDVEHRVEDHLGREEGARVQVPLMLAWSMSIHKAQGMTLDKVSIDLSQAFERGQAYVALSRAVDLNMLQVRGFHPSRVRTDPLVLEWEKKVLDDQAGFLLMRRQSKARGAERDRLMAEKRRTDSLTLTIKEHPKPVGAVQALINKHKTVTGKKRRI